MAGNWKRNELHRYSVVLQCVVERITLCDRHAGITGIVHDERRRLHLRRVGYGRLRAKVLEIVSHKRGSVETVASGDIAVRQIVFTVHDCDGRAGQSRLTSLVMADERGSHVPTIAP